MPLPVITAATPFVVPATDAITYDKLWLSSMSQEAPDCNGDAHIAITLRPYRTLSDGVTNEFAPSGQFTRTIGDVMEKALSGTRSALASAIVAILAAVTEELATE